MLGSIDIAEFVDYDYNADINNEDLEVRDYTSTTLCVGRWSEAKDCSVILHQAIKSP